MSMQIQYLKGDATRPVGDGRKLICHVCNDEGRWGKGFVLALSKRWKQPEAAYRAWYRGEWGGKEIPFALGNTQIIKVEPDLFVANMIAQRGVKGRGGVPPIRYDALRECLAGLQTFHLEFLFHMPRIGCGLAGGDWRIVERIIQEELCDKGAAVYVYDLAQGGL